MKQVPAHEAIALLRFMTRVLCAVGGLALVFTTVNVTRFATSRDVPLPIAILLDPMIGTALAGVLYVDALLAFWGISPPAWSTALRWGAGCTAALMNSWESLWPDGQIGWPHQADPAAVLLHLTPALLLIALTETIAAYRRTITDLLSQTDPTDHVDHPAPLTTPASPSPLTDTASRSEVAHADHDAADRSPHVSPRRQRRPDRLATRADTPANASGDHQPGPNGRDTPTDQPGAPDPPPDGDTAPEPDVWPRAVALNNAARSTTGKPVSIWRLRTDLGIGPRRARQIRDQLLTHHSEPLTPE